MTPNAISRRGRRAKAGPGTRASDPGGNIARIATAMAAASTMAGMSARRTGASPIAANAAPVAVPPRLPRFHTP